MRRPGWKPVSLALLALLVAGGLGGWFAYERARDEMWRVQLSIADPTRPGVMVKVAQRIETLRLLHKVGGELRARARSDVEFVELVADWVHWNVRPHDAAPGDIISDGPFGALVRGHAYCDQVAGIAAIIFWTQGYKVRLLALLRDDGVSPHTVMEVRVGDKWAVVDPWSDAPFTRDGRLHTVGELDAGLLEYWGSTLFDAKFYKQGYRWRVFPFLNAGDVVARLTPKAKPKFIQPPMVAQEAVARATTLPPAGVRRAYVEARLDQLRGKDVTSRYAALAPRLADPNLRGALQYFTQAEAAEKGAALPLAPAEADWAPSSAALFARVGLPPPAGPDSIPTLHRETLVRLNVDGTPSVLRRYATAAGGL